MDFQQGKPYGGEVFVRAEKPCEFWVALESADGETALAETRCQATSHEWSKAEFSLTPSATVQNGRLALKLKRPGAVQFGYVFLQPGSWGRFKELPVRRDIADLLQEQGVRILRYGGSMVNNDEYRWKKMIGSRAKRPPYHGHWYDYSTNGWGIVDFMNFCEAAGFEYVPTFSMNETPESLADFIEFATGDLKSKWGQRRAAEGHPEPYRLKYIQLGNEERVDVEYAERFNARAAAIWNKNAKIIPVVGDFVYETVIQDAAKVTRAASGITNLDGQRRILEFAREAGHPVWFDLHVWTDGPALHPAIDATFSFIDALEKMKSGADFKIVIFEFNANNHGQRRALANALAINAIERDGRVPIALSANCLQPDGQNDNGWNQGLLFLSPSTVWLQPPGYVTQLYSRNFQPRLVASQSKGSADALDCSAKLSDDGQSLCCQVVNTKSTAAETTLQVNGFTPRQQTARLTVLQGDLNEANTASRPHQVSPTAGRWSFESLDKGAKITLEPHSITSIVFE